MYHNRSSNNSRVNTVRLSYEKNNQSLSGRRLSSDSSGGVGSSRSIVGRSSSMSNNIGGGGSRRFVPNVNSPTWKSLQDAMKNKVVGSISSSPRYASSPRHQAMAKYKIGSPSPRGSGGGFFGVTINNNQVSQQLVGVGVDSFSLTAASTNSIDDIEMKFSGSLDDEKEGRYCNEEVVEDCNKIEVRDEQEEVVGRVEEVNKVFGKDDREMRDVSLVEIKGLEQSKEEVSLYECIYVDGLLQLSSFLI